MSGQLGRLLMLVTGSVWTALRWALHCADCVFPV